MSDCVIVCLLSVHTAEPHRLFIWRAMPLLQ